MAGELGFYGQSVYVAELHRLRGWPASLISSGTTFYYLAGAALVVFVSEAIRSFGPRNCLIAGTLAMAAAAVSIGQVREPWQLYLANAVLAFGWAGTSLGIITNTLGLWFNEKRGMAISLALNGASFGGIAGVPLLVLAIGHFGFPGAMMAAAIAMIVLMVPVILILVGRPPMHLGAVSLAASDVSATQIRARAFRDLGFLSVSGAFALVLFAQVGFIVHLIAFLDSVIGRERAAFAVALMTAMAVVGRVAFSFVIDRLNQRLASALSFVSQAAALLVVINSGNDCRADRGLRGVRIFRRQSDHAAGADRAARVRSALVRRADQPDHRDQSDHLCVRSGVVGLLHDLSGGYALPFYGCIALELTAAVLVMIRGKTPSLLSQPVGATRRPMTGSAKQSIAPLVMTDGSRLPLAQQFLKVQPLREHRKRAIRRARPLLLRPVPVEFDAVLVGVAQIQRFADAVIAGAVELDAGAEHAVRAHPPAPGGSGRGSRCGTARWCPAAADGRLCSPRC